MASEMEILELLEERIRRVTEVIRNHRRENIDLRAQIKDLEDRLRKSTETIADLEEQSRRGDELSRQLRLLQEERQEIRGRVTRMLETFSGLEEMPTTGADH